MYEATGKIIFITGGARSGKSRFAEELAARDGGLVVYVATAGVGDAEMAERVRAHQSRRPAHWLTIEEPLDLQQAIDRVPDNANVVIFDCLTLWLANKLAQDFDEAAPAAVHSLRERSVLGELAAFCDRLSFAPFRTLVVANEVGCGIVPGTVLGRVFRDLAGRANQLVAARADTVYFTVAGLPLKVKGGA